MVVECWCWTAREKKTRRVNKTHASIFRRGKIMIKKNGSSERWNNILKQWMASARISFETIVVKCWNNVLLLISFSFRSNGNEHKIIDGHYTINKKRKRSSCSQSFTFKKPYFLVSLRNDVLPPYHRQSNGQKGISCVGCWARTF